MRSRFLVMAVAALLGMSRTANASNFCFNPGTPAFYSSLAVAQNFKMPKSGGCSPINGFDLAAGKNVLLFAGRPQTVSGTACLNTAADVLYVDYLVHFAALTTEMDQQGPALQVSMALPFPSLVGGSAVVLLGEHDENLASSTNAHANACIPQRPEIP